MIRTQSQTFLKPLINNTPGREGDQAADESSDEQAKTKADLAGDSGSALVLGALHALCCRANRDPTPVLVGPPLKNNYISIL